MFTDIIRQYGQMIKEENVLTITVIDDRQFSASKYCKSYSFNEIFFVYFFKYCKEIG